MERQRLEWERVQQQEQEANKRNLEKVKKDLGDQVKQALQAQQQQHQAANELLQENQQLMEQVTQLANYNDKLEEQLKRASPTIGPTNYGTNQLSTLPASPEGITKTKRPVTTKTPSAVAVDHPYNACQPPQNNSSNGIGNQNNGRLNGVSGWGQSAPSYSKQTLGEMGCPNQYKNPQWNNQKGYSQPWDKRSYPRGGGDNFRGIPERYQARVDNNRDQVCTCRNQFSPLHEPKLSKYDGSIPWRVFEVKLLHLAQRY